MHPLGWGVNHEILHNRFNWPAYIAPPSFVSESTRDVSLLKTHSFAPIITNLDVPLSNKWRPYLHNVYFDTGTSTAYIHITTDKQPLMAPAEESLRLALDYVAELNEQNGCFDITENGGSTITSSNENLSSHCAATLSTSTCWSPIVYYHVRNPNQYASCLKAALEHEHPPLVFYEKYQNAERVGNAEIINGTTVVFSMGGDDEIVGHLRIDVGDYQIVDNHNNQGKAQRWRTIKSMNFNVTNLQNLPLELKDEDYVSDLQYLRTLADEAIGNDPVVGTSEEMPLTRVDDRRMCMGGKYFTHICRLSLIIYVIVLISPHAVYDSSGECPLGNLFTDAMRWKSKTDFAVSSSGGIRGPGWPAGNVTVGDLWAALPFANHVCTGTMTGISIVRMLNYSTAVSTFESTYTPMGDRLLQMSGMKMTYNPLVSGEGPGRLMSVEVYDRETKSYQLIERLKLYTFTTDDWMCNGFDPYPSFLGSELRIPGEVAGVVDEEMGLQQIVGDYLTHLNGAYDTSIQGRLVNDTAAFEPMDFIQSADSCPSDHDWDEAYETCFPGNSSGSNTSMIIGIAVGVLALMFIVFAFLDYNKKQKIKDQQDLLQSATLEIKKRDAELKAFSIGASKFGDAVSFVDTLLDCEMDEDKMEKLALVKGCLIKGDDTEMHIPDNLGDTSAEEAYILQNYAGVKRCSGVYVSMRDVTSAARGVNAAANVFLANKRKRESGNRPSSASTRNFDKITLQSNPSDKRDRASTKNFLSISDASLLNITKDPSGNVVRSIECIPEFERLDASKQRKLFELLSFSNLKRWGFNVFQIADIDEENTLLFVAWAVICSPHSQIAMAKQLGFVGSEEEKVPGSLDLNDFDGYNFFDMDLDIDDEKLCGYIRAIQEDYQDVPYHNRVHAADVVQTLNSLIGMADESMTFQKEDLFLLLIASVIHDVKHPGRNNAFQVSKVIFL